MNIITWNMQGSKASTELAWNTGVAPLMRDQAEAVCCLQECGAVPESASPVHSPDQNVRLYNWGGTHSRPGYWIAWYHSDPRGNRCNLAVVSSTKVRPQGVRIVQAAGAHQWRPALGVDFGGIEVFSIHAISPGGPDARGLLEAVSAAVPSGKPWTVAGDFNREPGIAGYHCHEPKSPTYNANTATPDRKLDWCATSASYPELAGEVMTGLQRSDHYPVFYAGIRSAEL